MMDNNTYNLMAQMVEEQKSLWRIVNNYKEDACDCDECYSFWEKLEKDKETHIKDLEKLLAHHIK